MSTIFEQDLRGDIFDVFRGEQATTRVGDVLDHVVDQSHVAIDEVVPGAGLLPQAAIDELAVNVAQGHDVASSQTKKAQDDGGAALELIRGWKLYNCTTMMSDGNLAF